MKQPADFTSRVLSAVRKIPPGRVATYGDIATLAGRPRAARAVGNIMKECRRPDVPCHRVIAAGGRLGGYGGSEALKRALLIAERVPMRGTRVKLQDCRMAGLRKGREKGPKERKAGGPNTGSERERIQYASARPFVLPPFVPLCNPSCNPAIPQSCNGSSLALHLLHACYNLALEAHPVTCFCNSEKSATPGQTGQ
jgi:methylated-DNA-[protein]-cysteine S-methyltransferase